MCMLHTKTILLTAFTLLLLYGGCDDAVLHSEREDVSTSRVEDKIDKRSPPSVM